jgi:hypothetical protein
VGSPRTQIFTDSEYVANRISLAAKDVEIRTLKAELAATQHALDNARGDLVMKDTEQRDREMALQSDLRRQHAGHEADMQQILAEKERSAAAVSVQREREHRETVNVINSNHAEVVRSMERRHEDFVQKMLLDQKAQLEADYRRALDCVEDNHRQQEADLRHELEHAANRRCDELREEMTAKGLQRQDEMKADMAQRRAQELDLLESAHKRELSSAASMAQARLDKAVADLSADWQRKLEDALSSAELRYQNDLMAAERRFREDLVATENKHREEHAQLQMLHSRELNGYESQIEATRRIKEEEKQIALHLQESELNERFLEGMTETDLKHKQDLYDMYQSCKDEVTTVRHRTLLEVGGSPRMHYLSPRLYSPPRLYSADTPLERLNDLLLEKEHHHRTSPVRSSVSPYRPRIA